ncbi:hypothetical protein [Flammeovirga sp. EKP202]|uniref:hypothetical protein n=1 Tax=Flammeovirga sp. EKP202 TaxID=2770592 RepID=UPI00165EED8B|nr:hypothetical protein [Flammeovirga sp. EKP202]MBD0405378.1 hypothetical protein [Flammeovirga sp. EKP202]
MISIKKLISILVFALVTVAAEAQNEWKSYDIQDGITTLKSKVEKKKNFTRIDYIIKSKGNFTLTQADEFFKNSDNHKKFWENCQTSEEIKKTSENEWYTYLFFDYSWPLSDTDCAQKYTRIISDNKLVFSGVTVPDAIEDKGVNRSPLFDVTITVVAIDEVSSDITLDVSFGSTMNGPQWMIKAWFPKGPVAIMDRIINELESK